MADDIERLRQAALKDPTQLVRFADQLVAAGRSEEAVQACRKGVTQRPEDVPLRLALGRALMAAGQLEEAQAVLIDAVSRQKAPAAPVPSPVAPRPPAPRAPIASPAPRAPIAPPVARAPVPPPRSNVPPPDSRLQAENLFSASTLESDSEPAIADPSIEEEIELAPPAGRAPAKPISLEESRALDEGPTGFEDDAPTSIAASEALMRKRTSEPTRSDRDRVTTLPSRSRSTLPSSSQNTFEGARGTDRVTTLPDRAPPPVEGREWAGPPGAELNDSRASTRPETRAVARTPDADPRRSPYSSPPRGIIDLRATARSLLGDVIASEGAYVEDVAPNPLPDEMTRAWDARRARSFVWLWVALVLLSGGIAGGYVYRARERARLLAIAVDRADARVLEATADGDFAARDAYAGALRAEPKMRKYAAMVALAAARLAADHGEDTDAAGWAMIKRADKEAERQKNVAPDPRADRELRQARALLALARGETCPPLVDSEDGDISARCALQRGDNDAARKQLADTIKATGGQNARALLALASVELGAGDLDAADAAYGKVLAAYPGHPRAVVGRLMVAIERGELPKIPDSPGTATRLGLSTEAWFHLARGLVLMNGPPKPGSADAANAELDLARRGILHDGRLALLYGRARLLQGKVAEAEQSMRVAERLNPNDGDVAVLDAEVALAKGYEDKVVSALSVGAQTPRKLAVLGRAQVLTGHYKEGAATLDAALAKRPGDAVSITYRAIARSHLGDAAGAQKELERAAASSSTARYGLGLLAFERRDLVRARSELEKALAGQNAEGFRARALLGRVLRDLGKTKEALVELELVSREAPALIPVHAALGRLYLDTGRDREARTELRQVLDGGSPSPDDRLGYAESLVHLGIVDQADKAIEDAVQAGIPATRVARLRLELQSWKGPKEAAIAAKLLEKERKGPELKDTKLTLITANAFRRAGDYKHASDLLREVLLNEPLRANLGIGRIQLVTNDWTGAESSFRAALDLIAKEGASIDDESDARVGLGRALLQRKAASEAQTVLETAVDKDADSAEAHYYLARAYQDKNDLDRARTQAERAVTLDDTYADAFALVGDLSKGPRPERAKVAYQKYLTLAPDGDRVKSVKKSLASIK